MDRSFISSLILSPVEEMLHFIFSNHTLKYLNLPLSWKMTFTFLKLIFSRSKDLLFAGCDFKICQFLFPAVSAKRQMEPLASLIYFRRFVRENKLNRLKPTYMCCICS